VLLLQRLLKHFQEDVKDPEGKYTEHILDIMEEIHETLEKLKEK
jgi:capsid portal protein